MSNLDKRLEALELRTTATTGHDERPPYTMTPDDALAVFDILAEAGVGVVEDVMNGVPPVAIGETLDELSTNNI